MVSSVSSWWTPLLPAGIRTAFAVRMDAADQQRDSSAGTKLHDGCRSASLQGAWALRFRVIGRPCSGYPAELLDDLAVQCEGIKLWVTQQHAGHRNAERGRHAVGEL